MSVWAAPLPPVWRPAALPPAARRWLQDRLSPEAKERCYFFNTFFFKKLTEKTGAVAVAVAGRTCAGCGFAGWPEGALLRPAC